MTNNLRKLSELGVSNDPRMPQADITSAPELFGDPFGDVEDGDLYGDSDYGDLYGDSDFGDLYGDSDYGDIDGDIEGGDVYGDVINDSSLGAFKLISGDPEMGGPRWNKAKAWAKAHRKPLAIAGGLAAGAAGTALAVRAAKRAIAKRRARKAAVASAIRKNRAKQTLVQQRQAREAAGKLAKNKKMPFFQVIGAKMNSSPIDPMEGFPADMFKYNLDRQASDTPFYQESALGVFALGTWTATATGVATTRYYTALILQLGINYLNAAPGTIFTCTATIPTINGTLSVSAQPWIFTIEKQYDVRFMFFPWQLVSNRPLPVLGAYNNANPIVVNVTGLPSASAVSLVVPGSLHPWTISMRNALI